MPPEIVPEFEPESKEYRVMEFNDHHSPRPILVVLCCAALFILLGLWSFTHQVSFAPPLANARLEVIRKIQHLQIVPLDEEIVPGQNSTFRWILGDGFSQPETAGVWISALHSSINFSVDSWTRVPRSLTLTLVPLLGPTRPHRTLTVSSVGSTVTRTISGLDIITIPLNGEPRQTINISCDSVDSALRLRVGPDSRPVCAKLISIVVKSA